MFRTAVLILSGNAFGSLMLLIRNLAIARLVSIEDYGIAATFAISMAVVEMASGLGLQQLIIQDKSGNDPALQAGLQGFNMVRGLLSGVALFLLAKPIAAFLGIPDIAWAYQLLALVPVLRGFEHFDIYRLNRKMQFRPLILTKTIPALISTLSVWPLYRVFGDYQVMLYAVLIQWVLTIITSHLVAARSYRLAFDREIMRRSLSFGWPILVTNLLLFGVFQGDKLIVGYAFGLETLAILAMGMTLTLTPSLVLAGTEQQFYLPQLSAVANDPKQFEKLAMVAMQTSLVSGLALLLVIPLLGPPLVHFLLGAKYETLIPLLSWLAILQAIHTFKNGCITTSIAQKYTSNAMIVTTCRVLALGFVWQVATSGGSLQQVIWIGIIGELCSFITSLLLVRYRVNVCIRRMALPIATTLILIAVTVGHTLLSNFPEYPTGWGSFVVVVLFAISLVSMRDLRAFVMER